MTVKLEINVLISLKWKHFAGQHVSPGFYKNKMSLTVECNLIKHVLCTGSHHVFVENLSHKIQRIGPNLFAVVAVGGAGSGH